MPVGLTGAQHGRWKLSMIRAIGEEFRFQAKPSPVLVADSLFPGDGSVEQIASVKLNARLIGQDIHGPTGAGIVEWCCQPQALLLA